MEIDHHNPSLKANLRNNYENLFLSTRHCNGSKSNNWPTKQMRKKGVRILNPCAEMDYGNHIFEHPITHRLIGVSPAGVYHIIVCDLNAAHLVAERTDRAQILDLIGQTPMALKNDAISFPSESFKLLDEQTQKMIPPIPYLPASHPEYEKELLLIKAMMGSA